MSPWQAEERRKQADEGLSKGLRHVAGLLQQLCGPMQRSDPCCLSWFAYGAKYNQVS